MSLVMLALLGGAGLLPLGAGKRGRTPARQHALTSFSSAKLQRLYDRWRVGHEAAGGDHNVLIPLGAGRGRASGADAPRGAARLDLIDGKIALQVSGLNPEVVWHARLIDNQSGGRRGALPDEGDATWDLGPLRHARGAARLEAVLDRAKLATFEIDAVVVVAAQERSHEPPAVFGLPRAFQRIYTKSRKGTLEHYAHGPDSLIRPELSALDRLIQLVGAREAAAATIFVDPDVVLSSMAAAGAELFMNETFDGNGRTCATCHPPANNFTLDAAFIATLAPEDPLFVAEQNPDLAELEVPALLRSNALILENLDGFSRPGVLRSVSHTLSLSQSLSPPICVAVGGCTINFPDGTVQTFSYGAQMAFADTTTPEATGFAAVSSDPFIAYPTERTGWGGDGAPGSGSLREFALGAIEQHFPRSLARQPGTDFRLPSDEELDALELFQLSLGRLEDPDLTQLAFKDPVIEQGRQIFMRNDTEGGTVSAGKCQVCHFDGGANSTPEVFGKLIEKFGVVPDFFGNMVFSTGVNDLPPDQTHAPAGLPRDGGMGIRAMGPGGCVNGHFDFSAGFPNFVPEPGTEPGGFGTAAAASFLPNGMCLEQFNPPPLIEAADTAPFFHNNAFETLEEAVAFYGSDTFNRDPSISLFMGSIDSGGIAIKLDDAAVSAVSHFLRVLNALENMRQTDELTSVARSAPQADMANALLDQAAEELKDARMVMTQTNLHPRAVGQLARALQLNRAARARAFQSAIRQGLLQRASDAVALARDDLVVNAP